MIVSRTFCFQRVAKDRFTISDSHGLIKTIEPMTLADTLSWLNNLILHGYGACNTMRVTVDLYAEEKK